VLPGNFDIDTVPTRINYTPVITVTGRHRQPPLSCDPMPLPAADDGPTIYDVATAALALLGLALSAYSLRRQIRRETRSVKVTCRYSPPRR
jgi:hypothetical protein